MDKLKDLVNNKKLPEELLDAVNGGTSIEKTVFFKLVEAYENGEISKEEYAEIGKFLAGGN